MATKGGRSAMVRLESRTKELEIELGCARRRASEINNRHQTSERHVKEIQFQQHEDHKNQDRMTELVQKLQQKITSYKAQVEEAEEIASLNLTKYRKAQQDLEECEYRSKMAEDQLKLLRNPLYQPLRKF